ncbi:MAG: bifunctional aspartate kinase/homoserine dehydrogenase I [Ferruginibacter sp.]
MQVLKFGGSSVANAENIKKVLAIIQQKNKSSKLIVVVSALGGITDLLLQCSRMAATGDLDYKIKLQEIEQRHIQTVKELIPITIQSSILSFVKTQCNELEDICKGIFVLRELSPAIKDRMMGFGELLSSRIIAEAMEAADTKAHWTDTRKLIVTDSTFGHAIVDFAATDKNINNYLKQNPADLYLAPGFIAANDKGVQTTLGRGGSDYTAAIFASAISSPCLEIWTDVSGMMTADPRIVANAKVIPQISYQEAMELSHFGAKVIFPPTIQPVMGKAIPVWVKNTFSPQDEGTLIKEQTAKDINTITGISSIGKISLLSLEGSGMIGIPGFSKRLFEVLAQLQINVIFITQSSSEHSICVGIEEANATIAKTAIDKTFAVEIEQKKVEPVFVENGLSIIALVGDRMKMHTGVSGKFFSMLGKSGVNIRAISQGSSERNISAVIANEDVKKALNVVHEGFFETEIKELNVFIAGAGNVGSRLLAQLQKQQEYLLKNLRIKIKVAGLSNSKKMLLNEDGINLENWQTALGEGNSSNINDYVQKIISKNLRHTIFVDATANEEVANSYSSLLEKNIAIVACNKIACSSSYSDYRKLKDLTTEYNAQFLFETNVGASLPIIGTLNDLVRSGDTVHRMQAVLSGTLNFVFNNYDGTQSFASVVRQAQAEGYTEPDPRLDLSGKDVMRKIMILAREAGQVIEMSDINNNVFLPEECMEGTVEDFYKCMEKHEQHFKKLYNDAAAKDCKLKFVASYGNAKAKTGLQHIDSKHDFFHLYGKDNIVLFYTDRYVDQPLVIKGAGAGADLTASGVFGDIIRASKA